MWWMSKAEYEALTVGASPLMRDAFGVKVLQCSDNSIIKLFRIKRLLSLSCVYPYSVRFGFNARCLNQMGVPSVKVERTFYCHAIRRHGIIYPMLEGETLSWKNWRYLLLSCTKKKFTFVPCILEMYCGCRMVILG